MLVKNRAHVSQCCLKSVMLQQPIHRNKLHDKQTIQNIAKLSTNYRNKIQHWMLAILTFCHSSWSHIQSQCKLCKEMNSKHITTLNKSWVDTVVPVLAMWRTDPLTSASEQVEGTLPVVVYVWSLVPLTGSIVNQMSDFWAVRIIIHQTDAQ